MAKELKCSDVGMKTCNFVAQGRDEKEVMTKAAEHARNVHGMTAIPPDVEKRARAAIRETQPKPFTVGQKV
jgi:predicted small metal-binding protein